MYYGVDLQLYVSLKKLFYNWKSIVKQFISLFFLISTLLWNTIHFL